MFTVMITERPPSSEGSWTGLVGQAGKLKVSLPLIIFRTVIIGYGEVSWVISAMMESFDRGQVTTNPVNFDSEGMVIQR